MSYPSIFNDVIGPVMRGPSSSHCAASLRIGRICRDLMDGRIEKVVAEYDPEGSLATTHATQGSDMGLVGGLLGWDADDERLPAYRQAVKDAGLDMSVRIVETGASHPNTYQLTLINSMETRTLTALSTGGGMIEVIAIDGAHVSMAGDCFETLVYVSSPGTICQDLETTFDCDDVTFRKGNRLFIEIKSQAPLANNLKLALLDRDEVLHIRELAPVLPVLSRKNVKVPFITCEEMLSYSRGEEPNLWELAVQYESDRGDITHDEVFSRMRTLVRIMQASVHQGLKGTTYADRILGCQSSLFREQMDGKRLIDVAGLNEVILFVTAIMEVKSGMGVFVAAPTAGSCGALPGACLGIAASMGYSENETVRAMLAAGMIGVFVTAHASFAAEVGGCQAECGSGSGMAAAALVSLAGGTLRQSLSAASMALQNSFGMVCDPVANRVEVPCLGKNVMAATNALACANMALAGFDAVVPLDEVIGAMDEVGRSLPSALRCTALGGLSVTKTSRIIEARLRGISGS